MGKYWLITGLLIGFLSGCATQVETIDCEENPDSPRCTPVTTQDGIPPRLYVDPPFGLSFSCLTIGCDEEKIVTLENRGGSTLAIARLEIIAESGGDLSIEHWSLDIDGNRQAEQMPDPYTTIDLRYQETSDFSIRYIPTDAVEDVATLRIAYFDKAEGTYDEAVVEIMELPISARYVGVAEWQVGTDELDFGFVAVGETKTAELIIENTTPQPVVLGLDSADLSEDTPDAFELGMGWSAVANPGDEIRVPVTFTPTEESASFGTLVIQVTGSSQTLEIPLKGTSIEGGQLGFLNGSGVLDFGDVHYGIGVERTLRLRNDGGSALDVGTALTVGSELGFSIETAENFSLGPLEEAVVVVRLTGAAGGTLEGLLAVNSNPSATIVLLADCAAPQAAMSQTSLNFGDIAEGWISDVQYVDIYNAGTGELVVSSLDFEVGTSAMFQVTVDGLPASISPDDPPLRVGIHIEGYALGDQTGVLLVQSNSILSDFTRINLEAAVVTCDKACPTPNGLADCRSNSCGILSCSDGFHDVDLDPLSGCECQEERGGSDVGASCSNRHNLGTLGDACSEHPNEKQFVGTLHSPEDIDVFFFSSDDASTFLVCDGFGDSSRTTVQLLSGPPGLVLCANIAETGVGCGGYTTYFDPNVCGQNKYEHDGSYGTDDDKDVTAWVMWHPDASPSCGEYTLKFRARD